MMSQFISKESLNQWGETKSAHAKSPAQRKRTKGNKTQLKISQKDRLKSLADPNWNPEKNSDIADLLNGASYQLDPP